MPLCRALSSRGRLYLEGADRVRFVHSMVTNDVARLHPGEGCHAAMLTKKGKLLADLVIYADEERLLVELDPELRHKVREVLEGHLIADDVLITDVTEATQELGVYGPDAREAVGAALGVELPELPAYAHLSFAREGQTLRVAGAPELAMPGLHVFGELEIPGELMSDEEWEARRIEAGTPRYGVDMDEDRLLLEVNLKDAVSFTKGCYLGQEVIARATARGHVNRKLCGLVVEGDGAVAAGARLSGPGRDEAGVVTSSVISPRLGAPIALGYVHRSLWDPGTELTVHDPAGPRPARVHSLPFLG